MNLISRTIGVSILLGTIFVPALALAQTYGQGQAQPFQPPSVLPTTFITVQGIFSFLYKVAAIFLGVVLVVAVFMFIYAGFKLVFSGSNEEEVTRAKNIMIYGLLGIGLAVLALGIVSAISNFVTSGSIF